MRLKNKRGRPIYMSIQRSSRSFLYRTDEGEIDATTWWRGALPLVGIFIVLTLGWILIEPLADKSLATTVVGTIAVLTGNLYRLAYGFACVLLLICLYNLSAKRWRNLGRPSSFAGILPVAAAVTAALHWLEPRVGGELSHNWIIAADIILAGIFLWSVVELGNIRACFAALRH
jgi:uncharacterized membrane protein YhaH (DUF805 family)